MADINLAPGTEYIALARRRRRRVYGITFFIVLAILASAGGLFLVRQNLEKSKRQLDNRISSIQAEITRLNPQARRVELFEGRLISLDSMLDNHLTWDPFLGDLERLLPAPVVINTINVNVAEKTVGLEGDTPDIDLVAQTLASLVSKPDRPTIFTSANVTSVARKQVDSPEGEVLSITYTFNADLEFDANQLSDG